MKSKKIVKIELRNPSLRCIRNNFRDIIKLAVEQESRRLFTKAKEYRKRSRESINPVEKERLEQERGYFGRESDKLDSSLSKSIIQCELGAGCRSLSEAIKCGFDPKDRPTNLDMVWLPFFKAWYCVKDSNVLIENNKILRREGHPDYTHVN